MAILTPVDQVAIYRAFHGTHFVGSGALTPWTKPQLQAAVQVVEDWISTNQASFLLALTIGAPAFDQNASGQQKTLLFCYVALRRAGVI